MSEFEDGKWSFYPVAVRIIGYQVQDDSTVLVAFELEYNDYTAYALLGFPTELLSLILAARQALMRIVATGIEPDQQEDTGRWN